MAEPQKAKKPKRVRHFDRVDKRISGNRYSSKGKLVASLFSTLNHNSITAKPFSVLVIIMLYAINILWG